MYNQTSSKQLHIWAVEESPFSGEGRRRGKRRVGSPAVKLSGQHILRLAFSGKTLANWLSPGTDGVTLCEGNLSGPMTGIHGLAPCCPVFFSERIVI